MTKTPEQTLLDLINHFGWTSWELGTAGEHELGNGLSVSGLSLDNTVQASQGYGYDMHGSDLGQFSNVSARHTGQYSSPDCMHDSETLSPGMLSQYMQPGEYAIADIDWDCEGNDDHYMEELPVDFDHSECEPTPQGWLFLTNERDLFTVRAQWEGELIRDLHLTEDISEAYSIMSSWLDLSVNRPGVTIDVFDQNDDIIASETIA